MDTILLTKKDGTQEEVELIMTFKVDKFNNDYVFYRNNKKYYAAKYVEKGEKTILSTELSEEEKVALSAFFNKLHEGGKL